MGSGWLVFMAVILKWQQPATEFSGLPHVPLPPSPVSQYLSLLLFSQPATIQGPRTEVLWNSTLAKLWD